MVGKVTSIPGLWPEDFAVEEADIEYLYELILEREEPLTTDELALALVERRSREAEKHLKALLSQGNVYRPSGTYQVGQQLFFPAFAFAKATVVGIRPGHNPEYGSFEVIQVRFNGEDDIREFASKLQVPHKLDQENPKDWLARMGTSPRQIFEQHRDLIRERLVERLSQEEEFISLDDFWLLKGMLPEIHVGHLNIAEALIEVQGRPLATEEILPALELPNTHPRSVQVFALNLALRGDERFSEVGPRGKYVWYLRRLEPAEVSQIPERLIYIPIAYNRQILDPEMVEIIQTIDDEATEEEFFGLSMPTGDSVTIALPYHHFRSGTLPLTPKTRIIFPEGDSDYTMVTFVDTVNGERFHGWVVYSGKYIAGLTEWYERIGVTVGAYITLSHGKSPLEVLISYAPHRIRKEWVRAAKAQNERLTFEMRMQSVGCDYDDLMMIAESNREKIDALWKKVKETDKPLYDLLLQIFPELARLSPQGTVHSRTLYTAVNLIKRCPPAPILAELKTRECFTYVGNGYWVFKESEK